METAFKKENWANWSRKIKSTLKRAKALEIITNEDYPSDDDPDRLDWDEMHDFAYEHILHSIEEDLLSTIQEDEEAINKAYTLYHTAKSLTSVDSEGQRKIAEDALMNMKMLESDDLNEHFHKLRKMYSKAIAAGCKITQAKYCEAILTSLPKSFDIYAQTNFRLRDPKAIMDGAREFQCFNSVNSKKEAYLP